jgi:imidazolonepropionase-like amidohydrolase
VRDVGNELDFIRTVRDEVDAGRGLGPRLLLAGEVDGDSPMALGVSRVNSAADAKAWVKKFHDAGFQQMKIYSSMTSENVKAVAAEAHALGMTVTGHIPQGMDIYDGVNDGMDQVNHIQYVTAPLMLKPAAGTSGQAPQGFAERLKAMASVDVASPATEQLLAFLKQHGTVIDDTSALFEVLLHPASEPVESFEPGVSKVAPELRAQLTGGGVPPEMAGDAKQSVSRMLEVIGALHKAGIPIVAGTDQCVPGFSVYRELELYVRAGFTPMEALQAATIVPARVMKVEAETGTVERGKRADLAILDRNPLDDIHNIRTVRAVVADGVVYDSAPLWTSVGFTP